MADISSIPPAFEITLQKGIEGGIAISTPDAIYKIARSSDCPPGTFSTSAQVRAHAKPTLSDASTREHKLADHLDTIFKIQELIRDLPTQYPGAPDMYGRNISIRYSTSESAAEEELHLYGSVAGHGIPHPTEEQRQKFDQAVELIKSLAGSQ